MVAVLVGWYGLAVYQTSGARSDLATAQDNEETLTQQQKTYDDLVETQSRSQATATKLSTLLATDLRWSRLLHSLRAVAPTGVTVDGVTGTLDSSGATATATSTAAPGTTKNTVGTLTVSGTAPSRAAVAAYVDALAKVCGLANPLVGSASMENSVVQFSVRLDITRGALGGRFTAPSPCASAAK
jgi:Tfp pilus assembly protein PilN